MASDEPPHARKGARGPGCRVETKKMR